MLLKVAQCGATWCASVVGTEEQGKRSNRGQGVVVCFCGGNGGAGERSTRGEGVVVRSLTHVYKDGRHIEGWDTWCVCLEILGTPCAMECPRVVCVGWTALCLVNPTEASSVKCGGEFGFVCGLKACDVACKQAHR